MTLTKNQIQLWVFAAVFCPALAFASMTQGSLMISAKGEASRAPELARMRIVTTSICYDTSLSAKEANSQLATPLLDILKSYVSKDEDKVSATGGRTIRQTETVPGSGGQYKVICERKWRAENQLSLQTSALNEVSNIEEMLLKKIDAEVISAEKAAQTFAEIYRPTFDVRAETLRELRLEAQAKAWEDAKAQLKGFKSRCELKNLKLVRVSPPDHSSYAKYADGSEGTYRTPIIPEEIVVRTDIDFTWTFDPVTTNCATNR